MAGVKPMFCIGIFTVIISIGVSASSYETGFMEWSLLHAKNYSTEEEAKIRETIFAENTVVVESLNRQYKERDVTFKLNQFADMTAAEFKSSVLMQPASPVAFPPEVYATSTTDIVPSNLPDSFDWRERKVISSVKDQGSVGSCWAFSTVGNIEGQWALSGHPLVSLSAELLVDCDATFDPNNMNTDCGVFGGWPYLAYQYLTRLGGIESEEDYPYCSGFGKCFPCMAPGYNKTRCGPPVPPTSCIKNESCAAKFNSSHLIPGLKLKSWVAISKNETVMRSELVNRGPLSIAINAGTLQFYHSGVWDPILPCNPKELNHAVLLVGYGVQQGLFRTKPYWLVKNSWGEKWGEKGYFRIVRGKGRCGVDQQVTSAVLDKNY